MNTKIWHLYPTELGEKRGYRVWWDKTYALVVYANTAIQARLLASTEAGDEGKEIWISSIYSHCVLIGRSSQKEDQRVLIRDFGAG